MKIRKPLYTSQIPSEQKKPSELKKYGEKPLILGTLYVIIEKTKPIFRGLFRYFFCFVSPYIRFMTAVKRQGGILWHFL